MNAPKIAEGYSALLKAIRTDNSLPEDARELMVRTAVDPIPTGRTADVNTYLIDIDLARSSSELRGI